MTIYEVLVANINALGELKIPAREPEIFQTVSATINDLTVCCRTIEAEEAKNKKPEKPDENDIPVINLDEIPEEEDGQEAEAKAKGAEGDLFGENTQE